MSLYSSYSSVFPEDKDVLSDNHSAFVSIQGCDVGTIPLFNPQPLFGLCSGPRAAL